MSCVTGIQPQLMEAMVCYLDDIISYICTPSVCMCVTASMCMYVHADVDLCACVRAPAFAYSSSRRPRTDAQRQMWSYMKKNTHTQKKRLLIIDRASVEIKSGGQRKETEWKTVWQKQANGVERKTAPERLTDRRVGIIDRGSDRESMWWRDNRQIDGSVGGERRRERSKNKGAVPFCSKLQNEASETLCLPLQHCLVSRHRKGSVKSTMPSPSDNNNSQ